LRFVEVIAAIWVVNKKRPKTTQNDPKLQEAPTCHKTTWWY